jgi:hypothetical protein
MVDIYSAARRQLVNDGIETAGIMAADPLIAIGAAILRILLGLF